FRAAAILLSSWVATSPAFIRLHPVPAQGLRIEGFVHHAPSSQKDRWPVWSRPRRRSSDLVLGVSSLIACGLVMLLFQHGSIGPVL
ncbi:MAG: hypothetical protein WBW28_11940, partial [Pseudolabrys sp.]